MSLDLLASLETLLENVMPAQGFCVSCCRCPHWGLCASRDSHPLHQEWCNQHTGRLKASHLLFLMAPYSLSTEDWVHPGSIRSSEIRISI